jgi:hypothetical protein
MSSTLLHFLMLQQRRSMEAHERRCVREDQIKCDPHPCPHLEQSPVTQALERPARLVELDTRQNDGFTITLEWDRDTGKTQIVVADVRNASQYVLPVPPASALDAFRHPFRYVL